LTPDSLRIEKIEQDRLLGRLGRVKGIALISMPFYSCHGVPPIDRVFCSKMRSPPIQLY
jgi:hypothetical protein